VSAAILLVAAMLVGHPTTISTDMTMCPNAYGCADIPGHVIHMQPDLVEYLNLVVEGRPASTYMTALAVLVFAHEARHVHGELNEWRATQWAKSHSVTALRLLGAAKPWAVGLRPFVSLWERRMAT
jgi:hypothetical protein